MLIDISMLTAKKKAFVEYYKTSRNGSDSARKAGYSPKSASILAYRLLHNDKDIQAIIQQWEKDEQEQAKANQEKYCPTKDIYVKHTFDRAIEEQHAPTKSKYWELAGKASGYLSEEKAQEAPAFSIVVNQLNITLSRAVNRTQAIDTKKVIPTDGVGAPPSRGSNLSLLPLPKSPTILNSASPSANEVVVDDKSNKVDESSNSAEKKSE
jgi:Terminase small subunit